MNHQEPQFHSIINNPNNPDLDPTHPANHLDKVFAERGIDPYEMGAQARNLITAMCAEAETYVQRVGLLSVITSTKPNTQGKSYSLDNKDGSLRKEAPSNLYEGTAEVQLFEDASDFCEILEGLDDSQALSPTIPKSGFGFENLTTKAKPQPYKITRSSEDFEHRQGRGVLIIDYDARQDRPALSKQALVDAIHTAAPGLRAGSAIWWCSSSSFIYNGDTELTGLRGQRYYLLIEDATDTRRALQVLNRRLWLNGHGCIEISKAGSLLTRCLADEAMASGARLDYCGPPVCKPPINQRRPEPEVISTGGWIDTRKAIPDLTPEEQQQYDALLRDAKAAAQPEADRVRAERDEASASALSKRLIADGVTEESAQQRARSAVSAARGGELAGDFEITLDDGVVVTVSEILRRRELYDGRMCRDPIEPDYLDCKTVGHLNLSGNAPNIYSHAHGGTKYRLRRGTHHVQLQAGERDRAANEIASAVAENPDVFLIGGEPSVLRRLGGQEAVISRLDSDLFASRAEECVSFSRYDERSKRVKACDPDDTTLRRARTRLSEQKVRVLRQIIQTPIVTPEGLFITTPGYDAETKLYLDIPEGSYFVPRRVSRVELIEAVRTIWAPFRSYTFENEHSKAAMVASILGVFLRPILDIAPGLLIEAPSSDSGKSYIGKALHAFSTGKRALPSAGMNFANEDEVRKQLTTDAQAGVSFMFLDNLRGYIASPQIEALLTGNGLSGRIVGFGQNVSKEWRPFICLTSNNATLNRDMARRLLKVSILPSEVGTSDEVFSFSPEVEAMRNREAMAQALLTIFAAYAEAGSVQASKGGTDYREWERMVRAPVVWLAQSGSFAEAGLGLVGDPAYSIREEAGKTDAETTSRAKLLHGLWAATQGHEFTTSSILRVLSCRGGGGKDQIIEALGEMNALRGGELPPAGSLGKVLMNVSRARYDGMKLTHREGGQRTRWFCVVGGEPVTADTKHLEAELRYDC